MRIFFHADFQKADIAPDNGGVANSRTLHIHIDDIEGLTPYHFYNATEIDFTARNIVFVSPF